MIRLNANFNNIGQNYLFSETAKRTREFIAANPTADVIRLGIGDVTLPLTSCVTDAMHAAVEEMGKKETFRGYPPDGGYDFLREAICGLYESFGIKMSSEDVFVSDGAKSDMGNLVDIFADNPVIIPDPVYPVYSDSNLLSGRTPIFLAANKANSFLPMPGEIDQNIRGRVSSLIYMCSPNNPTGAVYTKEQLEIWVEYALATNSIIIFDSAYEAFCTPGYPHSIYEVEGAKRCAIEVCSFSKSAGFTGTRCGFTVVPTELTAMCGDTEEKLNKLWSRRQATKFNGVSYIIQRAAQAALSEQGRMQSLKNIEYYKENARIITDVLTKKGIFFSGGTSSPYIWMECPSKMGSWEFFDYLLAKLNIVGTPGAGFGANGEGFFRLTAFGDKENTLKAAKRIEENL